jgi:hypothetical protein
MSSHAPVKGRWVQTTQPDKKGKQAIGRWHYLPTGDNLALCGHTVAKPYTLRDHKKGNCRDCEDALLGSMKPKGPVIGGVH